MARVITFGNLPSTPAPAAPERDLPDWAQADPARIERSLARALALPSGGWFAVDDRANITATPRAYTVDGHALVLWRGADGSLRAAPEACPHMGASLACARVRGDKLVCPWHGLELGERHGKWHVHPAHDDGVLAWVRLPGEAPSAAPVLAPRPASFIAGVIRMEARCDPGDILANRLDPWHGVHYHPHSFVRLRVLEARDDLLLLRVAYKVVGPLAVEVDATFHCPDARTIVMTIVDGEGVGSLVETHATPIAPGRTAMIEATLATSDRRGFAVARRLAALLRPAINARAARLWQEDIAYAERRYQLRAQAPVRLRTIQRGEP
jgi:isorenieratene synthase